MAKHNVLSAMLSKWEKRGQALRKKMAKAIHEQISHHQGEIDRLKSMLPFAHGAGGGEVGNGRTTAKVGRRAKKRSRMTADAKASHQTVILKLAAKENGVARKDVIRELGLTPIQATTLLGGLVREKKLKQKGTKATAQYIAA